jgi:DNA-binding beta-propeller fold protein YncE
MSTTRVFAICLVACGGSHPTSTSSSTAGAACPQVVHDAIASAYTSAKQLGCKLEREDGRDQYEVKLEMADGTKGEADVTPDGKVLALEEVVTAAAVPEPVMTAFHSKYPNETPARVERITQPGKPLQFELTVRGHEELTFSATGELLETEPADEEGGYATTKIALPGGGADGIMMDYLLFDPRTNAVWVPAGNTGSVDVVDVASGKVSRIEGFATQEMERRGKKRTVGPSSATLGPAGIVYVGNRGDFSVCSIDERALAKKTCGKLDAMPDGIAYVAPTNEVWVTTPRDKSVRILDGATLAQKARLTFEGEPEGFAVDATRKRFYTNLEDKDVTLAIDLASHAIAATWQPHCGEDGPHGLRLVEADGQLIVACSAEVHALDVAHDGKLVGQIAVGDGVDDLDYANHLVYAGAAKSGSLAIASLSPTGSLTARATVQTATGARNGVVAANGAVYLAHGQGSELVVVAPAH